MRNQLGLTVPGTHVPGPQPTSLIVLLHTKKPSGPIPKLCRAAWGLLLTPPLQPHQWCSPRRHQGPDSIFLLCRIGSQGLLLNPQCPSWACHPPPATRPRGPPSAPAGEVWQALSPEALCSLIRKRAAGGLLSQSKRFIVVFRGRLGAM